MIGFGPYGNRFIAATITKSVLLVFLLISFSLYGSLLIGESNPVILLLEVVLTITGLFCFLASFYEHRISNTKT